MTQHFQGLSARRCDRPGTSSGRDLTWFGSIEPSIAGIARSPSTCFASSSSSRRHLTGRLITGRLYCTAESVVEAGLVPARLWL